jgi:hypothetical protein
MKFMEIKLTFIQQNNKDFMLELTKHQNNVGIVLQEGSRLINSGNVSTEDDAEIRKQMKLLNDMWEALRMQAVERQAQLHERLMKLQNEQLSQMDAWLAATEARIQKISQLADSLDGLVEQKNELARLQDDLVKEQEAVDCLKQIIVVVDDTTNDQAFSDLENKLSNLSDRWSNVCKFVGNRWFTTQDLIIKLQSIEADFNSLNTWISNKSADLYHLMRKTRPLADAHNIKVADKFSEHQAKVVTGEPVADIYESMEIASSLQLIKILKEIEHEMQSMHSKLNDMNEIGEQIGTHLHNSPSLNNAINNKMDVLEFKWNHLLEQMEYLSKVCTELQHIEIRQTAAKAAAVANKGQAATSATTLPAAVDVDSDSSSSAANNSKKRRMQADDLKDYRDIDSFVSKLNAVFDAVKHLTSGIEEQSLDAQQEALKVNTSHYRFLD